MIFFILAPLGPISANAEEPWQAQEYRQSARAYLRERGGTGLKQQATEMRDGLSPRTRRNHSFALVPRGAVGPISANAEEPAPVA